MKVTKGFVFFGFASALMIACGSRPPETRPHDATPKPAAAASSPWASACGRIVRGQEKCSFPEMPRLTEQRCEEALTCFDAKFRPGVGALFAECGASGNCGLRCLLVVANGLPLPEKAKSYDKRCHEFAARCPGQESARRLCETTDVLKLVPDATLEKADHCFDAACNEGVSCVRASMTDVATPAIECLRGTPLGGPDAPDAPK